MFKERLKLESSKPGLSFSIEMLAVIAVALVLAIAFLNSGIFSKKNVMQLAKTFDEIKTAQIASYQDTGFYAGQTSSYPYPDGLISISAITDDDLKSRWRGPYLESRPVCPYAGCQLKVDFDTGAASQQGQTFQYFVVATNVPMRDAIELSRKYNGKDRVSECITDKIKDVVQGSMVPCKLYLESTSGGSSSFTNIYYSFTSGTY